MGIEFVFVNIGLGRPISRPNKALFKCSVIKKIICWTNVDGILVCEKMQLIGFCYFLKYHLLKNHAFKNTTLLSVSFDYTKLLFELNNVFCQNDYADLQHIWASCKRSDHYCSIRFNFLFLITLSSGIYTCFKPWKCRCSKCFDKSFPGYI